MDYQIDVVGFASRFQPISNKGSVCKKKQGHWPRKVSASKVSASIPMKLPLKNDEP